MKHTVRLFVGLAGLVLSVGCQPSRTMNVSVSIDNQGVQPVTVWITRTGERDADWLAPEDLALAAKPQLINGAVIPPGKTGELGPLKGRFNEESYPILRVYAGELGYDQLLATSVDSQLRVDVVLDDGMNRLKVVRGAKLEVVPGE